MPSKHDMLKKLRDIASLEKELWNAFLNAEEQKWNIHPLNFPKLFAVRRALIARDVGMTANYPLFLIGGILSAFAIIVVPGPFKIIPFLLYFAMLYVAGKTRDKFISEHIRGELATDHIVDNAFGIDNISLSVFNMFEKKRTIGDEKLDKPKLESVIKLVKSSHEYSAAAYGFYDYARKLLIGAVFSSGYVAYKNWDDIKSFYSATQKYISENPWSALTVGGFILAVSIPIGFLLYLLLIGGQKKEITKKRYLLMLNILKESYV